jgi:two-component sensor histidine kinase
MKRSAGPRSSPGLCRGKRKESAIKDKLLRVVGHDIKNNINGIQGMLN